MSPDPVDLILPSLLDQAAALALLDERLEFARGRRRVADRTLLDSFDGRLRAAGLRVERPVGRGAALELHEPGAPVRRAEVPRAKRHLVEELPPGAVRERLAPVLEERALLPAVRVRSRLQPLSVVDGERKAVVRLEMEHPALIGANGGASVRTLEQLRRFLAGVEQPAPDVLAFFSMVDRRKKLHRELVASLPGELPGVADVAIPNASAVELMGLEREPVVTSAPRHKASEADRSLWAQASAALGLDGVTG